MVEPNALTAVLDTARRINDEWCWPAAHASLVITTIERLGLAVLGVELWEFGDGEIPTVKGWSQYELRPGKWDEVVRRSARLARDEIFEHSGNWDLWVSISWAAEEELGGSASGG